MAEAGKSYVAVPDKRSYRVGYDTDYRDFLRKRPRDSTTWKTHLVVDQVVDLFRRAIRIVNGLTMCITLYTYQCCRQKPLF